MENSRITSSETISIHFNSVYWKYVGYGPE